MNEYYLWVIFCLFVYLYIILAVFIYLFSYISMFNLEYPIRRLFILMISDLCPFFWTPVRVCRTSHLHTPSCVTGRKVPDLPALTKTPNSEPVAVVLTMFSPSLCHRAAKSSREEADRKSGRKVHAPAPHAPGHKRRSGAMDERESGGSASKHKKKSSSREERRRTDKVADESEPQSVRCLYGYLFIQLFILSCACLLFYFFSLRTFLFTYLLTYLHLYVFIYSLIYSLTYVLIFLFTYLLTYVRIYSLT